MDQNTKNEFLATQVRLRGELIFKNFIKYIELLRHERREDFKVTKDVINDRARKSKKLETLHNIILKKIFISRLDFQCIKKFNGNQQFFYDNGNFNHQK